jgi:hypothetical protein
VGKNEESPIFQEPAWVERLTLKPTNLRAALKHGEALDGKRISSESLPTIIRCEAMEPA